MQVTDPLLVRTLRHLVHMDVVCKALPRVRRQRLPCQDLALTACSPVLPRVQLGIELFDSAKPDEIILIPLILCWINGHTRCGSDLWHQGRQRLH